MNIAETVPEILDRCAVGVVPVNVEIGVAIEAHQQSPSANTLHVVVLACQPAVADAQWQLDYLTSLPDSAWEAVPDWESYRAATLDCIRRSIAWRSVCA